MPVIVWAEGGRAGRARCRSGVGAGEGQVEGKAMVLGTMSMCHERGIVDDRVLFMAGKLVCPVWCVDIMGSQCVPLPAVGLCGPPSVSPMAVGLGVRPPIRFPHGCGVGDAAPH